MKMILMVALGLLIMSMTKDDWQTNFAKAKDIAKKEHKYLLLNFSGSDWCTPCIRTKKEIFDSKAFSEFADTNLVLINADFPRLKKNKQATAVVKENEQLAEIYDKEGAFPMTLLLDKEGTVLKKWVGYPGMDAGKFVEQIKLCERNY